MKKIFNHILKYRYNILYILSIIFLCIIYYRELNNISEPYETSNINKTIWILWLQGWDSAPWLSQQVKTSWIVKNPGWNVVLLTQDNIKDYVDNIDYVYKHTISPAAKSDIIRLSVLNKHGGVWADATLLCMQPLDSWIEEALVPSEFWMYHGNGGFMDSKHGPASWFIVSKANTYIITKWKNACDEYWKTRDTEDDYFWMDLLFKDLYENDPEFKRQWDATQYIYAGDPGQSHTFSDGKWVEDTPEFKQLLDKSPPRVLKLWNGIWKERFPDINAEKCQRSNGYYAIQIAIKPAKY